MIDDANEKKKLFMVDDDEVHLVTAELFLGKEYEIYKMKSGNEALEYLRNNKFVPDMILLDIMMPNMDGWELLKKIKKIDFLENVPIVFLTAVTEEMEIKRACKEGVADYITKPFNMVELKNKIKEVIKGHKMK